MNRPQKRSFNYFENNEILSFYHIHSYLFVFGGVLRIGIPRPLAGHLYGVHIYAYGVSAYIQNKSLPETY